MIDVRHRGRIILAAYLLFCVVYLGAPLIRLGPVHVLAPSFLDRQILFLPWTIGVYASQFVLMFLALWLSPTSEALKHILTAIAIATSIAAVVFVVWPSAIPRPPAADFAFTTLYLFDTPMNCFPSLHVALAIIAAAMWPQPPTRKLAWMWALAIAVSTLTTKQHVLLDLLGGGFVGGAALVGSGAVERVLRSHSKSPGPSPREAGRRWPEAG